MLYKYNKKLFNYNKIISKKNKFGCYIYTEHGFIRSMLEYYFYKLLILNKIEFLLDKCYPNSSYRYDFYLIKYEVYIEIAGMMKIESYKAKIEIKKEKFINVIILETTEDMLSYIQKIKQSEDN
jgi:hypothetical protein